MKVARDLRADLVAAPDAELRSGDLMKKYALSRRTALRLLRLLVIAGLLDSAVKHRVWVFSATGREPLPIATVIKRIRNADDKDDELGVLTPKGLAAVYGYPEEAARAALAAAGLDRAHEASSHRAKPEARGGELPQLERRGVCRHSVGWLHHQPDRQPVAISQDSSGPFALPADPLDEWAAWRLGDPPMDGQLRDWTWGALRGLVQTARARELNRAPGVPVTLPPRRPTAPTVNFWITGRRLQDPSNKRRPNAVGWEILWHGMPDSVGVMRGGRLLLDIDPDATDARIVIAVLAADGEPTELIMCDELLAPEARSRAARAAHAGRLAALVELLERAYDSVGWQPTHRIV